MSAVRTDIHRPSLLDPSEYSFVAAFYQGDSKAMMDCYRFDHVDYYAAVESAPESVFKGNFMAKATCDHCGAHFNHGVLFRHGPTGDLIHVGHICASDTVGLPSRAAAVRKSAEKAAAEERERVKRQEAGARWAADNAEVVAWLSKYGVEVKDAGRKPHPFLDDMARSLYKWGTLFPNQVAAVEKFMANEERYTAEKASAPPETKPTTPLIEGRREITGTILSTKWQESQFGNTPKMLVKEADGNKVWGTIAESVFSQGFDTAGLKGEEVTFVAKVERSKDDEHFGFFSRPSKMRVTETAANAA